MLKKFLLVLGIFSLAFGMEEPNDEPKNFLEILPVELWDHIASFLDGKDLFLNTDMARKFNVRKETRERIINSFLDRIEVMKEYKDIDKVLNYIKHFFKTSHLTKKENLLRTYFDIEKSFIKHLSTCSSDYCSKCKKFETLGAEKAIVKISRKLVARNNRWGLSEKAEGGVLGCIMFSTPIVFVLCIMLIHSFYS